RTSLPVATCAVRDGATAGGCWVRRCAGRTALAVGAEALAVVLASGAVAVVLASGAAALGISPASGTSAALGALAAAVQAVIPFAAVGPRRATTATSKAVQSSSAPMA